MSRQRIIGVVPRKRNDKKTLYTQDSYCYALM
jgi:hypothetical protein